MRLHGGRQRHWRPGQAGCAGVEQRECMKGSVVCGVDLWPRSEEVARLAVSLADELDGHASIVHVTHGAGRRSAAPTLGQARELRRLVTLVERLGGAERSATLLRAGEPAPELLEAARELDAELLVVGSRGLREIGSALLGSVSCELMREAPCPVVVVPPVCALPLDGVRSVVVGVYGGERDLPLLRLAADLAGRLRASLHAVHAFQLHPGAVGAGALAPAPPLAPDVRDAAEKTLEHAVDEAGVRARKSVVELPAAEALERAADQEGAGLIAVASQGHGKLHSVLHGSVTVCLAAEAPAPVLVLPPAAELGAGTGHYELSAA
jgi:nucleotide-binding universal stress UspA family protein